jgi:glycosyltransferase involved in cell wall biosynthesis
MRSKGENILVLTYWPLQDALIRTYTLPYLRLIREEMGDQGRIILVTLEKNGAQHQFGYADEKWNIEHLQLPYLPFGGKAILNWMKELFFLRRLVKRQKIDVIHAWCTPAGAIGYYLSKWTGKPLIIDSYEPHAEAMVENGTWSEKGRAFRILFRLEKKMSHHAEHLIAASAHMKKYAKEKYQLDKSTLPVKPACTDLELFKPDKNKPKSRIEKGLTEGTWMVYAGKFGGIYLEDEVFSFAAYLQKNSIPDLNILLLTSTSEEQIHAWCRKHQFPIEHVFIRFVPFEEVPQWMALADFAITPVKSVPSKKCCTPIKDGEYWACGLPMVITPGISDDSDIIAQTGLGVVCDLTQVNDYPQASQKLLELLSKSKDPDQIQAIRSLATKHRNFEIARKIYREIYA